MRIRPLAAAFPLLLASAGFGAGKSHVVGITDPYSGLREWHLRASTHHCANLPSTEEWGAHLDFSAFENPDHTVSFAVAPEISQHSALKTHGHAVLETLVDGVSAQFPQSSEAFTKRYHVRHQHSVVETIPFALERKDVIFMSEGKSLQFRVDTRSGNVERCASNKDLRDLSDFLAQAQIN